MKYVRYVGWRKLGEGHTVSPSEDIKIERPSDCVLLMNYDPQTLERGLVDGIRVKTIMKNEYEGHFYLFPVGFFFSFLFLFVIDK